MRILIILIAAALVPFINGCAAVALGGAAAAGGYLVGGWSGWSGWGDCGWGWDCSLMRVSG